MFCIKKKLLTLSTALQLQISVNFVILCVILFKLNKIRNELTQIRNDLVEFYIK